ncbi:MAG: cyclopropane-fatty-acyl-phospholipid synthase [Alphaproteobacteria bacterium HGW-Alphaproteobacteria-4]|nr:MAG: cyclopropane-fatty-acyl-phospholipid synthase [Alphaproteobacteria bacterium HGW-Alphaproteobacteria-4]
MPFDIPQARIRQRIAIIGGGISGLAAAYLLADQHEITLYEAEPRLGGHARTVLAGLRGDQPVDTGFIVFNYANYPHLTRMFAELEVPVQKSDMSFGASIDGGRVEYGLRDLGSVFGQRRNLLRPGYLRMLADIARFNARAEAAASEADLSIGALCDRLGMGAGFRNYYLLPVAGAIWSTPPEQIADFPARSLLQFFRNHALLTMTGQHQWWTVAGGSIEYVRRLTANLASRGVKLRAGTPVRSVTRGALSASVHPAEGGAEAYDQVIFACHSDVALRLLAQPTSAERRVLGALGYQDNRVILHRDEAQMPKRRACWSSWVYKADTRRPQAAIGVTYWMNRLQGIPESDPLFVTLNPAEPIRDDMIYDEQVFRHPVFDRAAIAAQVEVPALQGVGRVWFAGAWARHGFHEDGFASAVRVAREMGRQFA